MKEKNDRTEFSLQTHHVLIIFEIRSRWNNVSAQ
jgi:hypothetical protein